MSNILNSKDHPVGTRLLINVTVGFGENICEVVVKEWSVRNYVKLHNVLTNKTEWSSKEEYESFKIIDMLPNVTYPKLDDIEELFKNKKPFEWPKDVTPYYPPQTPYPTSPLNPPPNWYPPYIVYCTNTTKEG